MVEYYPIQLGKSKRIDNIIGILMLLSTIVFVFVSLHFKIRFIVGVPMILYGVYGLATKRIWAMGSVVKVGFVIREDSVIYSISYIIIGIFLSLLFY